MKKDEPYFQRKFLNYYKTHPFFQGSHFVREVVLQYNFNRTEKIKDEYEPYSQLDFIELDKSGNFHLWEAKILHKDSLKRGHVVGQIMFYDFLFNTFNKEIIRNILVEKGFNEKQIRSKVDADFKFKTWNILVCGGEGWEISAGINPIMWTYPSLREMYFADKCPNLNVFHFYEVTGGFDLKNIWELNTNKPQMLHKEAFIKYLNSEHSYSLNSTISGDEMKGIYLDYLRKKRGITDEHLDILDKVKANDPKQLAVFLKELGISEGEYHAINQAFGECIDEVFGNNHMQKESSRHFNNFIGRDWFK